MTVIFYSFYVFERLILQFDKGLSILNVPWNSIICYFPFYIIFFLQEFEHLEEARIELLRDLIWKCTNIDSQTCVDHDQVRSYVNHLIQKLNFILRIILIFIISKDTSM